MQLLLRGKPKEKNKRTNTLTHANQTAAP